MPSTTPSPESQAQDANTALWAARRRNNVRLAWVFVGIAVALFAIAIWKYRPV